MKLPTTIKNSEFKLTDKEYIFADYYLGEARFNATAAAKLAGYSERTARQQGCRLLTNVSIQQYLHEQTAQVFKALGTTKEKILTELVELALSRPGQTITKDSPIPLGYQESKNFKTLSMDGMEVDQVEKTVSFNYAPKMKALTMISEHLGLMNNNSKPEEASAQQISIFNQINKYISEK